ESRTTRSVPAHGGEKPSGTPRWDALPKLALPRSDPGSLRGRVSYHLSLFRLSHWLPRREAHPEIMQGTAEFHDQIADTFLPQAEAVFDDATALHAAVDMCDPQPAVVQ